MADSSHARLFRIISICRLPISPAPATASLSLVMPLPRSVGASGLGCEKVGDAAERQLVALGAEPGDDAVGAHRHERAVPEFLALMDIGDMDLDHRRIEGIERVQDGHGIMREGGRVDDDAARALPRLVDPVHDLVFAVALVEAQLEAELARERAAIA